ncbi:MAG: sigma-70 family RNA polymerase sigma factor [Caldithrix sp.]|nr:sigma-70 family RNA polymerase sigma factor [Caldithrix sp.]
MNLRDINDTELVKICKNELPDRTAAFSEIVRRYKNFVFGLAFNKLMNHQDAEDATQETFIRVFHGMHSFRQQSGLKTWLSVITTNVCLSILLSEKYKFWRYHVSLNGEVDLNSIESVMISKEKEYNFWKKIGAILKRMYSNYRKVFILKYFKSISIKLIAVKIDATIGATKMRINRAKDQFIKLLFGKNI